MAPEPRAAAHGPPSHPDSSPLPAHLPRSCCCPPPPGGPPGLPLPRSQWGQSWVPSLPCLSSLCPGGESFWFEDSTSGHCPANISISTDSFGGDQRSQGHERTDPRNKQQSVTFCANISAKGPASWFLFPVFQELDPDFQSLLTGTLCNGSVPAS